MKVRILTTLPGRPPPAGSGDIADIPDDQAEALVAAGRAEYVGSPKKPRGERAVKKPQGEKRG